MALYTVQMVKLDDTLRELGSRVTQARLQGQEAAELKKSGEISVLQKELGSKSKYVCAAYIIASLIPNPSELNQRPMQIPFHITSVVIWMEQPDQYMAILSFVVRFSFVEMHCSKTGRPFFTVIL